MTVWIYFYYKPSIGNPDHEKFICQEKSREDWKRKRYLCFDWLQKFTRVFWTNQNTSVEID